MVGVPRCMHVYGCACIRGREEWERGHRRMHASLLSWGRGEARCMHATLGFVEKGKLMHHCRCLHARSWPLWPSSRHACSMDACRPWQAAAAIADAAAGGPARACPRRRCGTLLAAPLRPGWLTFARRSHVDASDTAENDPPPPLRLPPPLPAAVGAPAPRGMPDY
eukprot:365675-Chlamydomonas_euryale.AAC.4